MFPTIEGNNRPNAPQWPRTRVPGLELIWHHIVPYNKLRDVWNRLVRSTCAARSAPASVALRQYLELCQPRAPQIEQWADNIRTGALDRPQCDGLGTLAVWPPWNIVEGPATRLRTDDPGDNFIDRYTHGLTAIEHARMRTLEALDRQFDGFLAAGNNPNEFALRTLGDAVRNARQPLACENPIFFRAAMWDQTRGRWSKVRSGEQVIRL